jgi:Fe-S oxidoreductase
MTPVHRQLLGSDKRVQLMATCLCDSFYDDVARATVEVLEHLGCMVDFPEKQTCCGQPAFNGGHWAASRKVVRHTVAEEPALAPRRVSEHSTMNRQALPESSNQDGLRSGAVWLTV